MKIIIAALALLALAAALPVEDKIPKILRSEIDQRPDGSYKYVFETDDGTARQEEGFVKEVLDEEKKPRNVVVVRGAYSYVNSEGKTETITYEADELGFHPFGESIPKPPGPQASSRR